MRESGVGRGGLLLPLWARGKSNKIELMGVWSFRGQRVGFAGRHWWVVVEMRRMELDPLSAWQSTQQSQTPAFNCRW